MVAVRGQDGGARLVDRIAFGAVVVLLGVVTLSSGDTDAATRDVDFGAVWLLALATGLAVLGRRLPATAALANLATTVAWHQVGYASAIITVPYLVSFYLLGLDGDRVKELLVGGLAVVGSAVAILAASDQPASSAASAVGWTLAALLLGELSHHRRMLLREYEERARRAEAETEREAGRRIAQTQLEIARDLHDVLAHTVAVMTVQASAGREALGRGEDASAAAALEAIRQAGREATGEVGALIAVLRDGSTGPALAPAPGLDRIPDLADGARSAGIDVTTEVDGGSLPEVVELTAYRVVQEGLTNVVRHAHARRAWVTVRRQSFELLVVVTDDGTPEEPGPSRATTGPARRGPRPRLSSGEAAATGFGLRGMRERVEALGGALAAGPVDGGGWHVEARLPVDGAQR
ncbi:hypothetical protein HC251_08605 [Iamia sp. SCSIO 61187]|uniref:sensor histidine kinase n=1 Tax=Iamia sp. SCSIO 61187 TaxID=2722752 RepID=UPI001C631217|nr:histidine kinase [Iamia sp. SCSIO 61187]QYG92496.1 hypothetical protein HC251_08605 [Iamia sp. SCSIO 61187]